MDDSKNLFDKPMHELCEAFVRERFAEPAMFGRADVEEWIANPEWIGIIDFDKMPAFMRHFDKAWEGVDLCEELWRFATPAKAIPEWMHDLVGNWTAYTAILEGIVAGRGSVYYPISNDQNHFPVVMVRGMTFRIAHDKNDDPLVAFQTASVRDVLEIVNAEVKGFRPRRNETMTFLNRCARNAIAIARKDAERDFDEAVAVSADGTKIVKAGKVLVCTGDRQGLIYPASAFQCNKARLHGKTNRITLRAEGSDAVHDSRLRTTVSDWPYPNIWNEYIVVDGNPSANGILIIGVVDCPEPLPAKGRKIS